MNFTEGYGQALVDAAFLAHGIVRAPKQLFHALDEQTKRNLVGALRATRKFTPFVMNWLFFSAMVEAALRVMGESDYDLTRVDYAVNMFESWYLGDGVYGDGPKSAGITTTASSFSRCTSMCCGRSRMSGAAMTSC